MPDSRPIGVFDSGVGGLTVLAALHDLLPDESTIYLGDLARCPYGVREQSEVRRFALEIADRLVYENIKLLVIACNTATAAAGDELRRRYDVPVIGVVVPGAEEALRRTRRGCIGVLATDATVASGAYTTAITAQRGDAVVVEKAMSWLVPIVEAGQPVHGEVMTRIVPAIAEMRERGVDTIILGCTHFPVLRAAFEEAAGPDVAVVDSAATTAQVVAHHLTERDMRGSRRERRYLVTGRVEEFSTRARTMLVAVHAVEPVDLAIEEATDARSA